MAAVPLNYVGQLLTLFVIAGCEFVQQDFHLVMECVAGGLTLTDVIGTSHPVSRMSCAAMCSAQTGSGCVAYDFSKDRTCRLRRKRLMTTCSSGSDYAYYEKGNIHLFRIVELTGRQLFPTKHCDVGVYSHIC
jgi:hypothetical protein